MSTIKNELTLVSPFKPTGDQPHAINKLVNGLKKQHRHQVLLGATGTGKTFTMANVIAETKKPTLIVSHNKTLAAQLYEEMKAFFPNNSVSYFVSYYDYYQPEAYIPQRDIYIEKDAGRNDDLDRLRLQATSSLLSRKDTIIVASVSCIYGLGSPESYASKVIAIKKNTLIDRRKTLLALSDMQYSRNEIAFERGSWRLRGDILEIFPAYEHYGIRVEFFGDTVERIELIHPTSGETVAEEEETYIFPAAHYMMPDETKERAIENIKIELKNQIKWFKSQGKLLEAHRLKARTNYDLEMFEESGYCQGVENYSMHLDGRQTGEAPFCLLDYFKSIPNNAPDDWLIFIDESHITIPQIRGMFNGDRSRKQSLVDHGFRLPSALENRPLTFEEFEKKIPQCIHVSATPGAWEINASEGYPAEQVIRPTGLLDPIIKVKHARNQVPDLFKECNNVIKKGERVLVTVLTKKLAEELTAYLREKKLNVRYLHSEIDTLERLEILNSLRKGDFDILIGVNLLREGLDLPEVSLVCILDADKEGFLRSQTSLTQTIGRAARNVNSRVIMYGDSMTKSMEASIEETERRREIQISYNKANKITPKTIKKALRQGIEKQLKARKTAQDAISGNNNDKETENQELILSLENEMLRAADRLEFELASSIRDQITALKAGKELKSKKTKRRKGTPGVPLPRKTSRNN